LLDNGKIFVYGGVYFNDDTSYSMAAKGTIFMLDVITLVWSVPPLKDTNIPKLAYHTATLYKATMIVAFGKLFFIFNSYRLILFNNYFFFLGNVMGGPEEKSNNIIYYFFLTDYEWSTVPLSTTTTTTSKISVETRSPIPSYTERPAETSSPNKIVIIGASVGSVAVVLTILVTCSLAYNKHKRIKRNKMKMEGQGAFNEVESQIPN